MMAQKKNVLRIDEKKLGVEAAFTEEEIMQYARPDSMLDR